MRTRTTLPRRVFLALVAASAGSVGLRSASAAPVPAVQGGSDVQGAATPATAVYIGTYTTPPNGRAEGIYTYALDATTGALTRPQIIASVNPSFLTLDAGRQFLYAVNENTVGSVSAFAVDGTTGALTALNQQSANGSAPCFLSLDPSGQWLLTANYTSGNFAVYPVGADGMLDGATDLVQSSGTGPNTDRQEGPHAHMIAFDPSGQFVLGADLGSDRVLIYRLNSADGTLKANTGAMPAYAATKAGTGPRHFAFHPNGRYLYVNGELNSTVNAYLFDAATGATMPNGSLSTLPAGFTGTSTTAEIVVHPNGRFVYVSNRGHDSIAMFAVDDTTGTLTAMGHEPTQGRTPRSFAIDPTGTLLLAANQESDNVVAFRVDGNTGRLTATGQITSVPSPVCVIFR